MKYLKILLFLFSLNLSAQPPSKFYSTYGGKDAEVAYGVKETYNKQYVIVGSTASYGFGDTDAYMILLDSMGNVNWQKTFGGISNEIAKSVLVNPADSGFVFCGYTASKGFGGYDIYVVRTDKHGNIIWESTAGTSDWDFGTGLCFTSDKNIIVCGSSYNNGFGKKDAYAVKLSLADGSIKWQKQFGGPEDDEFNGIQSPNGLDFYLAGTSMSFGDLNGDMFCYKINSNGDSLARIVFGGPQADKCNNLSVTNANDVFLYGGSASYSKGKLDAFIVKFNSSGQFLWKNNFGLAEYDEEFFKITPATVPFSGAEEIAIYSTQEIPLLKKDTKTIYLTVGGDYYGGDAYSGSFGFSDDDEVFDIISTSDKGYLQVGYTKSFGASRGDILVIKQDSLLNRGTTIVGIEPAAPVKKINFSIFPNPLQVKNSEILEITGSDNNADTYVRFSDITGRILFEKNFDKNLKIQINVATLDLSPGLIYVKVINGNSIHCSPLVIEN